MAMYHLHAKAFRRSEGRSATGAAAYRAGERIVDERTGVEHDYTRKRDVIGAELCLPGGAAGDDRAAFWNRVEQHHKRRDATVARETEISLPTELNDEQRRELALEFAQELSDRYGVAIDVAFHAPRPVSDRDLERNPDQFHMTDPDTGQRHNGNWHAHLLMTACHVEPDGTLGKKCVELDPIHCQRHKIENMADRERGRWADMQNAALARARAEVRVDHRSYADRGSDQVPTVHLGGYAARMQRDGEPEQSERASLNLEIRAANAELHQLQERAAQRAAEREAEEQREWDEWTSEPGVCSATGRIVDESRMMHQLEQSWREHQRLKAAELPDPEPQPQEPEPEPKMTRAEAFQRAAERMKARRLERVGVPQSERPQRPSEPPEPSRGPSPAVQRLDRQIADQG
uniref:MobA/MobL family protein n=1 Tax=Chromohalobacter sp. 48-RD10 TaxID=2994063 RepID=UPI00246886DE